MTKGLKRIIPGQRFMHNITIQGESSAHRSPMTRISKAIQNLSSEPFPAIYKNLNCDPATPEMRYAASECTPAVPVGILAAGAGAGVGVLWALKRRRARSARR